MKIPKVIFRTRIGDNQSLGGGCAIGGEWKEIISDDLFKGKKIVLFSLPGAYTPTCSSKHLPGYEDKYEELKKYVDEVYCLSVNDSFVMNAWFRDQKISKVKPIGDGEGKFTKEMNMLVHKEGFGMRSSRYSAFINNGEVVKMFVEDGNQFKVSDVNTMLEYLKSK
jgi:peroxiredoxin|tara:strand:+ start:333 stop:830 length:498 start_codon:yes stop_codon:yes gene_type:complete